MKMTTPRIISTTVLVSISGNPPFCLFTKPKIRETRPEAMRKAAITWTTILRADEGNAIITPPSTIAATALNRPPVLFLKPNVIIFDVVYKSFCEVNNYSPIFAIFAPE